MEKALVLALVLALTISFTGASANHLEYQNKELNTHLEDGKQLYIKFADYAVWRLNNHNPVVEEGYVVGTTPISLADLPVRATRNYFSIYMPSEGWVITAKRINENDYSVQLHEWNGAQFLKTQFQAPLHDIQSTVTEDTSTKEIGIAGILPKKELIVLVKQSFSNYWNDDYEIFVKVFDKAKNPNPNFDDFFGTVNNAQINVTMINPTENTKYSISGITNDNGYWQGTLYFAENLSPPGKYLVDVTTKYGDSTQKNNMETFLFGVTSNKVAQGSSS